MGFNSSTLLDDVPSVCQGMTCLHFSTLENKMSCVCVFVGYQAYNNDVETIVAKHKTTLQPS